MSEKTVSYSEVTTPAKFDLHLHTYYSYDAATPVEYCFSRAKELKLKAFAITDHHHFDAIEEILTVAKKYPHVPFIPGAEITVRTKFGNFDLVCLGLPLTPNAELKELFDNARRLQKEWGKSFSDEVEKMGYSYTETEREMLLERYRPKRIIQMQGVTHVRNEIQRDYLIEKGIVKDKQGYLEIMWKSMAKPECRLPDGNLVVDIMHRAGAVVLIAHPFKVYFQGTNENTMDEIISSLNLDGIECAHPSIPPEATDFYRHYCIKHDLLSSAGTDLHTDPPHEYLKLSVNRSMAYHHGKELWLNEILERVKLYNQ